MLKLLIMGEGSRKNVDKCVFGGYLKEGQLHVADHRPGKLTRPLTRKGLSSKSGEVETN